MNPKARRLRRLRRESAADARNAKAIARSLVGARGRLQSIQMIGDDSRGRLFEAVWWERSTQRLRTIQVRQ